MLSGVIGHDTSLTECKMHIFIFTTISSLNMGLQEIRLYNYFLKDLKSQPACNVRTHKLSIGIFLRIGTVATVV
jgi:hypothetical protein